MRITSTRNPVVRYIRSLERSQARREAGVFLAEGVRLVREAVSSDLPAALVLYDPDALSSTASGSSLLQTIPDWAERSYEADSRVLSAAGLTENPQGVLAVLSQPVAEPLSTHRNDRFGIVLDRLSDPGNAGTILRTAEAAGIDYVAALAGSVDLFAPKVVRAGMGAHFRLPLYTGIDMRDVQAALPDTALVGLDVAGEHELYTFSWPEKAALVVGGEASGLTPEVRCQVTHTVRIPMRPPVESLNAAVAAAIVVYTALGPYLAVRG